MVLDLVAYALFSVIDLLKGAFIWSFPVLIFSAFGKLLKDYFEKKYSLSWLKSSFAATYITVLAVTFLVYFLPIVLSFFGRNMGVVPIELEPSIFESTAIIIYHFFRTIFVALIISLLFMPFSFAGSFFSELVKKKFPQKKESRKKFFPKLLRFYAGVYLTVLFASMIILFIVPWAVSGMLYFLFFWPR
jgi:hypothetical protein